MADTIQTNHSDTGLIDHHENGEHAVEMKDGPKEHGADPEGDLQLLPVAKKG